MVIAYIVMPLWFALTLALWLYRERQFHRERMEILKLIKASTLSEFTAENKDIPPTMNFLRENIKKAYTGQKDE